MQTRYKFLRTGMKSNSGKCKWKINEWKHEDELKMCHYGFHCSKKVYEAFSYVQGEIITKVEVKGKSESQKNKEVWTDMQIIKAWKWEKKDSVELAIYAAELVIDIYKKRYSNDGRPREAIEAAKKYIKNPNKKTISAGAYASAAAAAASDAASAAAYAAAYAASDAAAAYAAILEKIDKWMTNRIKSLKEIK